MMSTKPDILVIGGGITGQSAALAAAEQGARVTIVDYGHNAGSHANAGSLHVQMQSRFLRLNPHQAENLESSLPLYVQAVRTWEDLDRTLGGVELVRNGGLMLAETPKQMEFLTQKAAREAAKGVNVEILDRLALDRIAPYLGPKIIGAELCKDEGKLNPLTANAKMKLHLQKLGVAMVTDRITELSSDASGVTAKGKNTYVADQVILATAWGSEKLVSGLGLTLTSPGEPLHMNITEPAQYKIEHLVQHAERSITLKQFQSGQIVIGGGWPARLSNATATPEVLESSLIGNIALSTRIAPCIANLRILRTWAGVNTPFDGKSTIGPLTKDGRIIAALPGDAGYTLGPIVGRTAADLMCGITPGIAPAPFAPDRWIN